MKADIHPKFYDKAEIRCSCGAVYVVSGPQEKVQVEICRSCHPFYTGADKMIDTAGRVERFKARSSKKAEKPAKKSKKTKA